MSKNQNNSIIDYKDLSKRLFIEQNKIRKDPQSYIPKLESYFSKFQENILYLINENPLKTFEGKLAVEEAITFLKFQKPIKELEYNEELTLAAEDHIKDIGNKGLTSHEGSNGKDLPERIEKYIEWEDLIAESLDFGFFNPENIILNLLIDDGVKERFQRENLFNEEFNYCGIASGNHRDLNISCIFIYAKKLRKLGEKCNDGINYIHDYIDKTLNRKEVNNIYQENDFDAPDDTVNVKVVKEVKKVDGKDKKILKKIYLLNDTSYHVVEIEEN